MALQKQTKNLKWVSPLDARGELKFLSCDFMPSLWSDERGKVRGRWAAGLEGRPLSITIENEGK